MPRCSLVFPCVHCGGRDGYSNKNKRRRKARVECRSCKLSEENKRSVHNSKVSYEKWLFKGVKSRAKMRGLEFTLDGPLPIPKKCPILSIEIKCNRGRFSDSSASYDRFDNNLGYTKENTKIISMKANRLKSNASKEELTLVLKYMNGEINV